MMRQMVYDEYEQHLIGKDGPSPLSPSPPLPPLRQPHFFFSRPPNPNDGIFERSEVLALSEQSTTLLPSSSDMGYLVHTPSPPPSIIRYCSTCCSTYRPYTSQEFADACNAVNKELQRIPKVKHKEELVEKVAKCRLEWKEALATKDQRMKEELAAKDEEKKKELSDKNRQLGAVYREKAQAEETQIRTFIPCALQDRIIDRYAGEYKNEMERIRKNITARLDELTTLSKKIVSNWSRDYDEIEQTMLESDITRLSLEIRQLQEELPLPDLDNEFSGANKMQKDSHLFYWIVTKKENTSDEGVHRLNMYLRQWYDRKPQEYRNRVTFDEYRKQYGKAMAEIRQYMNGASAHVRARIPIEEGFEFRYIPVFGRPDLDEFTTVLINAIGLQFISASQAAKRNCMLPLSGTILSNAVTQKSLLEPYVRL